MSSIRSRARCVRCDNLRSARTRYVRSYRSAAAARRRSTRRPSLPRDARSGGAAASARSACAPRGRLRIERACRARACAAGSAPRAVPHRLTREPCRVRDAARPAQDAATAPRAPGAPATDQAVRAASAAARERERARVAYRPRRRRRQPHRELLDMRALPLQPLGRAHQPAREPVERCARCSSRRSMPRASARWRSPTSRSSSARCVASSAAPVGVGAHVGREVRDREIGFARRR